MARPLKVGIQLPEVEREVRWPELREMAETAEAIGLDSIWLGEHLLYRSPDGAARGPWEAWSLLGALATATKRVEIGPLVACVGFHNPAVLAKTAATIDEISGGRLIFGLGAGWNRTEFEAFGVPYDHRVSRFEDAFAIIRGLLQDGRVDYRGRWHSAPDCELLPRPTRPSGPPLLIGSTGARMLEIALPHVAAWNAWYRSFGNAVEGYRALRTEIDDACRSAGRDPAEVARTVALLVRFPGGTGRRSGDPTPEPDPIPGDPDLLAPALRAFAAEGVSHVQLVLDPITVESIAALEPTIRLLDAN
ncbi:MAG TPA: LLM class flavin-dependent oxidoreductase [Candidatus Limnocylindria bacterium]|nr:LLM class flavin-dependent oxidoreductase [Candidatus Limnocylindria bacterium]